MVGVDSPEAFEEVFWRVFTGRDYIAKDRLNLYEIDDEISEKFRNYIELVLQNRDLPVQTRYLSKNNNNVLRFASLQKCLPDAQIIVPFREPLQHALSLLEQHEHFCKFQAEDSVFAGLYELAGASMNSALIKNHFSSGIRPYLTRCSDIIKRT